MHKRMPVLWSLLSVAVCLHAPAAWAAVKPHAIFSDAMVLQQGMQVPVWGTADEGEQVTVRLQNQNVSATAKDGKWLVRLNNLKAGGPFEMTITGSNTIQFKNVLVGEVWICSGQSNMEWPLSASSNAKQAIGESLNTNIRLFSVPHRTAAAPQRTLEGAWKECGPETVRKFTAVGYFFGRDLQKALGVPVGLIQSAWGGTLAEAWTSRPALQRLPDFKDVATWEVQARERYARAMKTYEAARDRYEKAVAQAKEVVKIAPGIAAATKVAEKKSPTAPLPPADPAHNPNMPSALYNGMLSSVMPYAIRGAIWYQGESNVGRANQYRTLFPAMIQNWREDWGQGDFSFLFVQLAPFLKIVNEPDESGWAELREAQLLTSLNVPRTGMAVITDVGDEKDIHPRQKAPVGARLALAALAVAYDRHIVYSGPLYDQMKVEGDKAVLTFKHEGSGLVAKGDMLKGFAIAGEDRKFVNAQAEIRDNRVVVWSPKVAKPIAVRYGWANYPLGNLWNKEGLPASPFRTDDFPPTTATAQKAARK